MGKVIIMLCLVFYSFIFIFSVVWPEIKLVTPKAYVNKSFDICKRFYLLSSLYLTENNNKGHCCFFFVVLLKLFLSSFRHGGAHCTL